MNVLAKIASLVIGTFALMWFLISIYFMQIGMIIGSGIVLAFIILLYWSADRQQSKDRGSIR